MYTIPFRFFFLRETIMPLSLEPIEKEVYSCAEIFDFFVTGIMNVEKPIIDLL